MAVMGNLCGAAYVQPGMRTSTLLVALGLAFGAVSCGDEPTGSTGTGQSSTPPSSTQPPTGPPTSTEDPLSDPTPAPTGKPPNVTTVTGVVSAGVEAGCLLLDTGSETLLLLGVSPADAREGTQVRVTGSRSPGTATTCQQGVPFRVTRILPFE